MVLPTATPGISQKSQCLKPRGPAGRHPHDPQAARGDRDPPDPGNNGLFQSLSHRRLIVSLKNYFAFANHVLGLFFMD